MTYRRTRRAALALFLTVPLLGAPALRAVEPVLPPLPPWEGASRELMLPPGHEWATPFEASGGMASPTYDETVAWLTRLVGAAPELALTSLGTSPEGREIVMVVASREGASTPEELHATGRPVVLAHAGIHSGEIDGKDAGMMLLRDLTVTGRLAGLLDRASLLFVPILSVDGHERRSPWGRVNQRGPEEVGWRTNARNLNLNRDFAKLETPEVRALVRAFEGWRPDLHLDLHVTDGTDFQYDVTWGYNGPHAWSPVIAEWLGRRLTPAIEAKLAAAGHTPGPLFFPASRTDPQQGVVEWTAPPRFSNGYGDARHLPSVLVENHSLKPFDRRVLGTLLLLESTLETVAEHGAELARATAADRARRADPLPLGWQTEPPDAETASFALAGIEQRLEPSAISGALTVVWTGRPVTLEVPWRVMSRPTATAARPTAYWIPPSWPEVVERLALHGIALETTTEPRTLEAEVYRLHDAELAGDPFEGRARVTATPVLEERTVTLPPGSVRVPVDQPLGSLAMLLLEPASGDSFFQWGFFLEALQRTEYVEGYVMEPTARRMLEEDPELARKFREALLDPGFAADPRARLDWFYRRTPWYDDRHLLYPVVRER
ncbi:MAG: M14 family metallopeptidase [Thermoanaerobaculia bacterium]|nr:M14 family metallopeptidase [Thermoanaerobaculia bacterium]